MLDGLTANLLLRAVDLQTGTLALDWHSWAAANPDLRLIEVKRVFTPTVGGAPTALDATLPLPPKATLGALGAAYTPPGAVKSELWLQAMDSQGRRLHTRYTGSPRAGAGRHLVHAVGDRRPDFARRTGAALSQRNHIGSQGSSRATSFTPACSWRANG